ncbi:unnamed protein product, partial [Fusarium langsethiae]
MALLTLPFEIYLDIVVLLEPRDQASLTITNQQARLKTENVLYSQDGKSNNPVALLWAASKGKTTTAEKALGALHIKCSSHEGTWRCICRSILGDALCRASAGGSDGVVRLILNEDVDVNARREGSPGALQLATYHGHEKIVQLLLSKNADVNSRGGKLAPALKIASENGHDNIVELLLDKNA